MQLLSFMTISLSFELSSILGGDDLDIANPRCNIPGDTGGSAFPSPSLIVFEEAGQTEKENCQLSFLLHTKQTESGENLRWAMEMELWR